MDSANPNTSLRIGLVGLGQRGLATLSRYRYIPEAQFTAICDRQSQAIDSALKILAMRGASRPATCASWEKMVERDDIDLVYICTDWGTHAPISIGAMKAGKDVAVEVPAAVSVADCLSIVECAASTGRKFTMMENCCYDPFALNTLAIARKGLLGEIRHCEGAYIHDLRRLYANKWYGEEARHHIGNPYPTHGIGPICQLLDINRSDRLVELVSMSALTGNSSAINSTLLRTALGRTIMLQYDVVTPRPYSRLQTVCGSAGYASKYPVATIQLDNREPLTGEVLDEFLAANAHPWVTRYEPEGRRLGVENMMNYIMDRRLVECLIAGVRPDITPADAALWSSIAELTHISASQGSRPVSIPAFC